VGRLLVPLHFARYLATGGRDQNHLANTVRIFNTLIAAQDGSPDPERWDALAPEDALERMRGALADYPDWQEAARGRALRDTDMRWLLTRASLWRTAHQAAGSGEPTGDTAHKMAAWMALHIAPVHPDEVLDLPIDLLTQGRCSRPQAAWTLAELYRQVGLPCRALQVAGQDLLHVTPPGEDDFLVNAWMGVPLLELQTGRPLALAQLRQDAGPWNELAVAGGFKQATAEDFQQAQLKLPLHPRTFYDRMVTFAHLVDMLPQKPATGLRPARYGPDATIAIWPPVMEQILHRSEPLWRWRLVRAREVSSLLEGIRQAQLLARAEDVPAQWENTREALRAMRNRADVPEGIRVLEQALEDAAWFAALADFDAGKPEEAEAKLDAYLEDHAEGRWRLPARVLLAEVYAATDRPEAAQDIWQDLPPARRLYGIYRAEGLISPPASDAASN
jgi:hypothetical protein